MYLFSEANPFAPLDRRWRQAAWLIDQGQPLSSAQFDPWVEQAVAYQTALHACQDEVAREHLAREMPDIDQALAVYQAKSPLLRWAVEARILAKESFDEIARKCNLLPETVEAYEALFFAVADKLGADTWVVCNVIGAKAFTGLTADDLDVLWKMIGFAFGPVMLDAFIHGNLGVDEPATAEEIDQVLSQQTKSLLLRKEAIATHVLPVTPKTAPRIIQMAYERRHQEARDYLQHDGQATPAITAVAEQFLHDLETTVPSGAGSIQGKRLAV
jgi:hypothetical protein